MADKVLLLLNDLSLSEYSLLKLFHLKVFSLCELNLLYVKPIQCIYSLEDFHVQERSEEKRDSSAKQMLGNIASLFNCDESCQWLATGEVRYETDKLARKLSIGHLITGEKQAGIFKGILSHQKYSRLLYNYTITEFIGLRDPRLSLEQPTFELQCEPAVA